MSILARFGMLLVATMFSTAMAQEGIGFTVSLEGLGTNKTLDMVYVKGGTYQRGCSTGDDQCEATERPQHSVTVSDFYIGKYEITNAQWQAVMKDGTSGNNTPKTNITWYDAIEFTCKLSNITGKKYRLATDAEFEFAARGGTKSNGYFYSGSNKSDDVAWHSGNNPTQCFGGQCFAILQAVGGRTPNELDIYDMSGNVYEWTYDSWGNFSSSALTDPTGPATLHTQKVRRGGSYDQPASESRVSARKIRSIEGKDGSIGLRLALSVSNLRPDGMVEPCDIHPPIPNGGEVGLCDKRLITADGEVWANSYGNILIVKKNGAAIMASVYNSYVSKQAEGEWYTLNNFSLNIVSTGNNPTTKKYIYYLINNDNMSMMPEGGMPGRYERKNISEVSGASKVIAPAIAAPKTPEQLAPAGYNIDMSNPPTDGRDPRLIEGPSDAWLQDNVALNSGGTHRYRFDFDSKDTVRFVVYDAGAANGGSSVILSTGKWFTVDNMFLRITKNGKNYDYLYTVTQDGKTYYHISYQGYEPGDFRMFEKVSASDVPQWKEPTMEPYANREDGSSTYIPPAELGTTPIKQRNTIAIKANLFEINGRTLSVNAPVGAGVKIKVVNLAGKTVANFNSTGTANLLLINIPIGAYIVEVKIDGQKVTRLEMLR